MPRVTSIEAAVSAAGRKLSGVRVFDLRAGAAVPDASSDSLFVGIADAAAAAALQQALASHYPREHQVTAVSRPGSREQETATFTIAELGRVAQMPAPVSLFVPALEAEQRATIDGLRAIMGRLRSGDGCPWDREQDHRTLRRCLLEETHEVLAAIDREQWQELCVELGDLLLQVLFHAQLASERGEFDFDDVVARLREKLVARHPHVFRDAVAENAEAVLRQWDELKRHEAGGPERAGDLLAGVPPTLPALDRAQRVQRRAAHIGFDWGQVAGPLAKLAEEIEELKAALRAEPRGSPRLEDEMGDIIFAAVNVARFAGVDAEQALRAAVERFAARFAAMQHLAAQQGEDLRKMNLDQMDALWAKAKKADSSRGARGWT